MVLSKLKRKSFRLWDDRFWDELNSIIFLLSKILLCFYSAVPNKRYLFWLGLLSFIKIILTLILCLVKKSVPPLNIFIPLLYYLDTTDLEINIFLLVARELENKFVTCFIVFQAVVAYILYIDFNCHIILTLFAIMFSYL